jgi:hypothetical protein
MQLTQVGFTGPAVDDEEILGRCPEALADILRQINGFVQFDGGLHVRGACHEPAWHSLRNAWIGADAFHLLYPNVKESDAPFAEDCMGDQFLLRDDVVWKLSAETGEMESYDLSLVNWLEAVQADPVEALSMQPLLQLQIEGDKLQPGQLISAAPPFFVQSEDAVSLRAVPGDERRRFLADLASQIRDLPDGTPITFRIKRADDE